MRGFFRRGNFKKSASIFFARIFSEKRVLLRAFKILRGFCVRAFQIFIDKKASKTVIFQIEKKRGKRNLCLYTSKSNDTAVLSWGNFQKKKNVVENVSKIWSKL